MGGRSPETVSERRLMCTLASPIDLHPSGAVDRDELLTMVKKLGGLSAQELSWEVKGQLRGRNDT